MSQENVHVKADAGGERDALAEPGGTDRDKRVRLWVNWALALLTVVGAGMVMAFALASVMSTAACSDKACPRPAPMGIRDPRDCDRAADHRRRHPRHHSRAVGPGS